MKIRESGIEDIPAIMAIYEHARTFMAEHGNPNQWGPRKWPPEALIRADVAAGKSRVCVDEDDKVLGTFFYDCGTDVEPTYRVIEGGAWRGGDNYGVVHRIASGGTQGVGSFCLNWAFEQCGHLRIDTHEDNKVMQSLLKKLGFEYCGIIYVTEDNYPRMAFEKM